MVRCLGAEGETLRIPLSSPRLGGPGWEVNDRVAAFIKKGLQLNPEYGRVLLILHYAGHGAVRDNGLIFNADSQYPRTFNYDRTINPKLEIYNYLGESLEIFDCVTILDCCHSGYATRESHVQTRCAEVLSAVREDQSAFPKGIDSAGKVTARTFTAKLSALVSHRRGKGHESISFLDAIHELKTYSNRTRMPQFKMLFGSTSTVRVPLLSPSSTIVHGQSTNLSSASLKQGDVIRALFSVHMPSDIDSEGVQKLTDWLLKLDRQFGLHVSGIYPGNSTFLLLEASRSIWTSLEGLPSFRHVFDVSGSNAIANFQSLARQSNKASKSNSAEDIGLKERSASTQNESDNRKLRHNPVNKRPENIPFQSSRNAQLPPKNEP